MLGSGMFQDGCARWRLQLAENFPSFWKQPREWDFSEISESEVY